MASKPKPRKAAAATKRTVRKKAAGRKTAARKPAGKKTAGKKAAGKKAAGRKTAARRPAGKKAAGKKAAGRKAPGDSGAAVLAIGEQQGIREIGALKSQLDAAFAGSGPVRIDAGGVQSVDTAALQLLVAFENSMRKQSRRVEWTAQSEEFRRQADLADLAAHLGEPETAAGTPGATGDGLLPVF